MSQHARDLVEFCHTLQTVPFLYDLLELLCESQKREHFDVTLGFSFAKNWSFFPVFILLLFSKTFLKTKCKCEFPDYSSCGLIVSKLNQSVHALLIRTIKHLLSFNKH